MDFFNIAANCKKQNMQKIELKYSDTWNVEVLEHAQHVAVCCKLHYKMTQYKNQRNFGEHYCYSYVLYRIYIYICLTDIDIDSKQK